MLSVDVSEATAETRAEEQQQEHKKQKWCVACGCVKSNGKSQKREQKLKKGSCGFGGCGTKKQ